MNKNKRTVIVLGGLILIAIGIGIYIFVHLYVGRTMPAPVLIPPAVEGPQEELMDVQAFLRNLNEKMVQEKAGQEGAIAVQIEVHRVV